MSIDAQHRIGNLAKLHKEGRNVKKRTATLLVVVIGLGAFVAVEIGKRNSPLQTRSTSSPMPVAQDADSWATAEAESTPVDPAAKQRAIDAELNRAIKRTIEMEPNRAIGGVPSDASEGERKHPGDR
jgi:hypothetical protein